MRAFRILGVLVVLAMVLSACGGAATLLPLLAAPAAAATTAPAAAAPAAPATSGELKIATLVPLSGPVPTFGVSGRDGTLLAIDEWNAKGGVLGMKVVPIVEDSQCTPDPAVNAANKVIDQDKVHYIIGETCSKASIPVSEITNAKGVLQISSTSTNADVTLTADGKTKDYVFRACFIDPFQGKVGAKFAIDELKAKTAFIMLDQANDYVKGLAEVFEKEFAAAGGTIVGKESYTATDTDFSAILAKVADAKPDVVYLPDYYNIVNLAMKQAKEKGVTAPFLGGDGWDSSDLDLAAAEGGYYTNHYSPDSTAPANVAFLAAYAAKYKDDTGKGKVPDALAALAYDATNILLQSIQNAGVDDATKVAEAMEKLEIEAVSGKITFDAQHNPIKSATILAVTKDGIKFHSVVAP